MPNHRLKRIEILNNAFYLNFFKVPQKDRQMATVHRCLGLKDLIPHLHYEVSVYPDIQTLSSSENLLV